MRRNALISIFAQVEGVEPSLVGLEATVLPLNYTRVITTNLDTAYYTGTSEKDKDEVLDENLIFCDNSYGRTNVHAPKWSRDFHPYSIIVMYYD
jgi:hypothetical protein